MSAPSKEFFQPGYVGPSYLDQMVELLSSAATRDIVLDRTHYGELIWPTIFGRKALLSDDDMEVLREIEDAVGVQRIMLADTNVEAHWQRCVDNKEPLSKAQFLKARQLYDRMADRYAFQKKTLKDFVDVPLLDKTKNASTALQNGDKLGQESNTANIPLSAELRNSDSQASTPELLKLEKANTINDVLSKRIIKSKGPMYDELESDIRNFLKDKMGKIFGENNNNEFSKDEIQLLKLFCDRLKEKESKR